jgi:hypothetical protein
LYNCLKRESPLFAVFAAGLQESYSELKSPLDSLSYVRPLITVAYLFIAARFFMAAVAHRKALVFGMVCLTALVATGANALSAWAYLSRKTENSSCGEQLAEGLGPRRAEAILREFARLSENDAKNNEMWDISVQTEGSALVFNNRFRKPMDANYFNSRVNGLQKIWRDAYCSDGKWLLRSLKTTETYTYYSLEGERLASFSITPADCKQW